MIISWPPERDKCCWSTRACVCVMTVIINKLSCVYYKLGCKVYIILYRTISESNISYRIGSVWHSLHDANTFTGRKGMLIPSFHSYEKGNIEVGL